MDVVVTAIRIRDDILSVAEADIQLKCGDA